MDDRTQPARPITNLRTDDPTEIGPWSLTGRLGEGGMGVVYLAAHNETSAHAALKVINSSLGHDPTFRARFRREVETSRRVHGPYVAPVLGAEPDGDPPWLATRYIPAPTLNEHVQHHGPLTDSLVPLAAALLEGLASIHAAGVLHRDLKPSNVLLTDSAPVIIDFGISAATDATSITMTGLTLGSPGWMAPEQVRGEPTTAATDVFGWGAVMAYAASGEPPFGTGRPEALAYRIAHNEPNLASVPTSIRPLVEAALQKDAALRPTIDELRAALGGGDPGIAGTIAQRWEAPTIAAGGHGTPPPTSRPTWRTAVFVTAVLAILAASVAVYVLGRDSNTEIAGGDETAETTSTSTTTTTSTTEAPPRTAPTTTTPPPTTAAPPSLVTMASDYYWSPQVSDCTSQPRTSYTPLIAVSPGDGNFDQIFPVGDPVSIGTWDKYSDAGGQTVPIAVVVIGPNGQTEQLEGQYGPDWQDVTYVPWSEGGHTIVWFSPDQEPMACGGFEASLGA